VVLGNRGTGVHPTFEGSAVLFRGCGASTVQEWEAQCQRVHTVLAAQCRTVAGMALPGELAEQRWDMIPRCVRGTARRGFVFHPGACRCQSIKCPCRGSRYGSGEPVRTTSEAESHPRGDWPSSKAEPHPRGRLALERGGTSPEGATSPRARRRFASAVLCPSSVAEFRSRVVGPTVWWAAGATRAAGPTTGP
jgi:hypothetical protein